MSRELDHLRQVIALAPTESLRSMVEHRHEHYHQTVLKAAEEELERRGFAVTHTAEGVSVTPRRSGEAPGDG